MKDLPGELPSAHGAVYISCETPPYYFNIDTLLLNCQSDLPLDSLINQLENASCSMTMIMVQAENADFLMRYSDQPISNGRMFVQKINPSISLQFMGAEETKFGIQDNEEFTVSRDGLELSLFLDNYFVGGCFHEGIFWERR